MNAYRVFLVTRPGFYAQYSTSVVVWADDQEEAARKAVTRLRKTDFPDYSASMWRIDRMDLLGGES